MPKTYDVADALPLPQTTGARRLFGVVTAASPLAVIIGNDTQATVGIASTVTCAVDDRVVILAQDNVLTIVGVIGTSYLDRLVMSAEIIFDSSDGSVASSETLSKSAALFDEFTFFFSPSTNTTPHMSSSVKSPDGKKAILSGAYLATESIIQYSTITYSISGTTITRESPYYVNFGSSTAHGAASNVRLLRIVGHIYI